MKKYISILSIFTFMIISFLAFTYKNDIQNFITPTFEETKDFPKSDKNLRKWDCPTIADLDQDGYLDLVLNEHGFGIRICWNNKGKFSKPYDLIMGDLHGVSVGDFDNDGNKELVLSRGGGSGSNARNSKIFRVDKNREFTELPDFKEPLALMRGRTIKLYDGDNDGDLDLINFAFPSVGLAKKSENYIYENDGKGEMVLTTQLPQSYGDGQKTLLTDFNNDNITDILMYGHKYVRAFQGNGDLTYEEVTDKIFPNKIENVTSIVEIDFDNDGDFDLYFTRGKGFKKGETFFDATTNIWGFYTSRGAFQFEDLEVGDVLNIENYQAQWPNKSVYLGETGYDYEFPGETHSGRDIRLVNSDALGFPDAKNMTEKGTYIGYVGNRKWRIAGNIWSPTTGIVHGVKSYPETEHEKGLSDILLENKKGKFKNVTKQNGLTLEEHTVSASVADFNNDGRQDLIIVCRGDLIYSNRSVLYLNQGEAGFKHLKTHNIVSKELGAIGMAIETFDYNNDGKMDIIVGNERGKWHLFKNKINVAENTNFITVEVGNSPTGKASELGAVVEVESCNLKQIKRVGATGGNYSLGANHLIHFGLGDCSESVKVTIIWSNGETVEKIVNTKNTTITNLK